MQTGASFKKETAMADKSQTRVLRGGNIQKGAYTFLDNDIFIKDELVSPSIYLRKNDLITPAVTSLENIGKIARITEDYDKVTVGGFVFILRGFYNNDVFAKYLYYAIQSDYFTEKLKYITKASGSAFFNINKERFLQLILPIPTENEQLKIVSFLDEIFAYIDFIEQNQSDYSTLVESLKKAILQSAIQGKLVEQCEDDESASVLLEKIRAEKKAQLGKKYVESYIYKSDDNRYYEHIGDKDVDITEEIPYDLPVNWCWERIENIMLLQAGKFITASEISDTKDENYNYPCYGGNGLRGYVKSFNTKGDYCIIGRQGALCGNIKQANGEFYATEHAVVVYPYCKMNTDLLFWFLTQMNLNQYATATAQPGLAVSKIDKVLFALPPLAEQERIVSKINEIFAQL